MVDQRRNRGNFSHIIVLSVAITILSVILNYYYEYHEIQSFGIVKKWLRGYELEFFADIFKEKGLTSLEKVARLTFDDARHVVMLASSRSSDRFPPFDIYIEELVKHVNNLNKELRFQYWLLTYNLLDYENVFYEHSIESLEDIVLNIDKLTADHRLSFAFYHLAAVHRDKDNLDTYPVDHTSLLASFVYLIWIWLVRLARFILFIGCLVTIISALAIFFLGMVISHVFRGLPNWRGGRNNTSSRGGSNLNVNFNFESPPSTRRTRGNNHNSGLFGRFFSSWLGNRRNNLDVNHDTQVGNTSGGWFNRLLGNYFDPKKSAVSWSVSEEDSVVGNEAVMTVKFYRNNGAIFKADLLDSLRVEVIVAQSMVDATTEYEKEENVISVHFTPIKSGIYNINIFANGELIGLPACTRYFKPGCVDPFKSSLVVSSSLLVFENDVEELLTFDERDKYGNTCVLDVADLHRYQIVICECKTGIRITPQISFHCDEYGDTRNKAYITITMPGLYKADIFYDDEVFSNNVIFLVLSKEEMIETKKNISTTNWNLWYEAYIINNSEQVLPVDTVLEPCPSDYKKKKVYCYISPKFFIVKEYWLKIFPKKLYTFRINPTVKVVMLNDEIKSGIESFTIESGNGQHVKLYCQKRNVLVATFVKLLLKNIGGSECFEDKKRYFYKEVKKLHSVKANMRMSIKVNRETVVEDTWQAVKSLSPGDWWKKFEITFEGEQGLDYGGLSREWIHLLVNKLFNEELFRRFDPDNLQGLTHPNHFRVGKYKKLKYFELAGLLVGKCLIECSCDQIRQQYVKVRFTRSFLSQILGLGISWKHFETDDKEYYTGKIKYIIENDPEYLDIYFTEDVYDNDNQLIKTVELKSSGSKILVDESNKFEYIQRLAEYRLADCVKDEISAFLKGLQTLIPDGLLTMFDENELELLLCGMDIISLSDLKANHIQDYNSILFREIIGWFWTVISGFSQEELSRLLQFTTGCSQLPPEGFSGLNPTFKITSSGVTDSLPMAHTCFNQLCLPNYSSMQELKSKLVIAITEGAEGFGIS